MSKKVVLKVEICGEKEKQKALKAVSSLRGIESLAMNMNEKKLTVIGDVDPVQIVNKLKKWYTEILTVGPAKEPEKKDGANKDGANKNKESEQMEELKKLYQKYYFQYTPYCHVYCVEENPNSCVIC